jgi:hypothetical protein
MASARAFILPKERVMLSFASSEGDVSAEGDSLRAHLDIRYPSAILMKQCMNDRLRAAYNIVNSTTDDRQLTTVRPSSVVSRQTIYEYKITIIHFTRRTVMFFIDLSEYAYGKSEPNTYNIGWIEKDNPFTVGDVPEGFLVKLKPFIRLVINEYFGVYECSFCENNLNSGEIRVFGQEGKIYAAPRMIYHYVAAHSYLPPQEFIEAVIHGPSPGSPEYRMLAQTCSWSYWLPK